jgi:sugar phosphate isomerase/epimerase
MREPWRRGELDRRAFLKGMAAMGGAVVAASCTGGTMAQPGGLAASGGALRDRMGIQLYTVRDLTPTDYEGTLVKIREIGFREVEPTGYGTYTPQQFRAMLDRVGLTSPSTHADLVLGPNLEQQLAGYQVIGHRYARASSRPAPAPGAPAPAGAAGGGGQTTPPVQTVDTWKRTAGVYNQVGEVARKYGIKVLIHNHTAEFAPIAGSTLRPFDVLLSETDPALVVFELDVGWSSVAGQNAIELFRNNPGRFPLWHVKDVGGLATMTPQMTMAERQRAAKMTAVGEGEIDWKAVFAQAQLAGLQHYYLEIEGEAVAAGSLAAAEKSYANLRRILS